MLSLCLSIKREDRSPVASKVAGRVEAGGGESLEGPPAMNPIFLEEGKGPHFSNSPSPFPRPQTKGKAASNSVDTWLSAAEPRAERLLQQVHEDAQGAASFYNLNRSSRKGFVTTPIKKERKHGGLFFSVKVCSLLPGCSP